MMMRADSSQDRTATSTLAEWALAALVSASVVFVLFRSFFLSNGQILTGDYGDNRFLATICEHWHLVYQGKAIWHSPDFFWPERGVLGYSDALWAYSIPFTILRRCGLDLYYSMQWSVMVWRFVGFLGSFYVLRRGLRLSLLASLFGSTLCGLGLVFGLLQGHFQLLATSLLEITAACLTAYFEGRFRGHRNARWWLIVAAVMFGALFFTSFYLGFFAGLAIALTAVVALLLNFKRVARSLPRSLASYGLDGVFFLAAFGMSLLPTLALYLGPARNNGLRPWEVVERAILPPLQALDPRGPSDLWRTALRASDAATFYTEAPLPIPFVSLALVAGALVMSLRGSQKPQGRNSPWIAATGIAAVLLMLLPIKIGDFTAWRLVFDALPGAAAIRAPLRLMCIVQLMVAVCAAFTVDWIYRRSRLGVILVTPLAVLAISEQITSQNPVGFIRAVEHARLDRLVPPPPECRSFVWAYLPSLEQTGQIDAMILRYRFGIPTLNGYSGLEPKGWQIRFESADYEQRVRSWAESRSVLRGLCRLEPIRNTWQLVDPAASSLSP